MKKKVLVVDDDVAVRESLIKVLEAEDYVVVSAADGLEALQRFDPEQIDLLLLDLNLPLQNGWTPSSASLSKTPCSPSSSSPDRPTNTTWPRRPA